MKHLIPILLFASLMISSCNITTRNNRIPITMNVHAYIDGKSQLVIQSHTLYWHHLDYDAPGRWELAQAIHPTYINGVKWHPIWPDIFDSTNDSCNCDSSTFTEILPLERIDQRVWMDIVQGRGRVFAVQQPSAKNNYTLILEFDDNGFDGAEWYEVNLNYVVGASR